MENKEQLKLEFEDKLYIAFDFADKHLSLNETFEILKETFENCYSQTTLSIRTNYKEKNNIIYRSIK